MGTVLLILVVVLVVAALIFGVVSLLSGDDPGIAHVEPDGRATPLPNDRSLTEDDIKRIRFDVAWRGYRMAQIDRLLRRTAYDIGYKNEMIAVLEAEVVALREGREEDADLLQKARESAASPGPTVAAPAAPPARHRAPTGPDGITLVGEPVTAGTHEDIVASDPSPDATTESDGAEAPVVESSVVEPDVTLAGRGDATSRGEVPLREGGLRRAVVDPPDAELEDDEPALRAESDTPSARA